MNVKSSLKINISPPSLLSIVRTHPSPGPAHLYTQIPLILLLIDTHARAHTNTNSRINILTVVKSIIIIICIFIRLFMWEKSAAPRHWEFPRPTSRCLSLWVHRLSRRFSPQHIPLTPFFCLWVAISIVKKQKKNIDRWLNPSAISSAFYSPEYIQHNTCDNHQQSAGPNRKLFNDNCTADRDIRDYGSSDDKMNNTEEANTFSEEIDNAKNKKAVLCQFCSSIMLKPQSGKYLETQVRLREICGFSYYIWS